MAPSAPHATPVGPRVCSASAPARSCASASPAARNCSTTFSAATAAATGAEAAIRSRVERIEGRVVGGEGDSDEIAEEMRSCSQREYELQAEMTKASDRLTEVEVEAAHLGDRRSEAAKELASIAARLGEEVEPAIEALSAEDRAEIDRRLERLERRRAQIGRLIRSPSRSTRRPASTSSHCRPSVRTPSAGA